MSQTTVTRLIKKLGLKPHPEGGYYRETYRSKESIPASTLPKRYKGPRAYSTAIYFLIKKGFPSRLHRLQSDELWHYHTGGTLALTLRPKNKPARTILMGPKGSYQAVIPAGVWFEARVVTGSHVLVGCTVAPGFDFRDFQLFDK